MRNPFSRRSERPEPVPVLIPEPLATTVDELLAREDVVQAVRVVREHTGLDLLAATRAVRHRQERGD